MDYTEIELKWLEEIEGTDKLCEYCQWTRESHGTTSLCEGSWCEDAREEYLDSRHLDEENNE